MRTETVRTGAPVAPARQGGRSAVERAVRQIDLMVMRMVEWLAVGFFIAVACLCFYQIITRFVLEEPAAWTEAATRTAMIWSAFLGMVSLYRRGSLISVDFAARMAGPVLRSVIEFVHLAAALIVLGSAVYGGIQLAWRVRMQTIAGLDISISYAYAAVPVGAVFAILAVLFKALDRRPEKPTMHDV